MLKKTLCALLAVTMMGTAIAATGSETAPAEKKEESAAVAEAEAPAALEKAEETLEGPTEEEAPAEITSRRIAIGNGDHSIPAVITLPVPGEEKAPAVLMLHGTGSHKDEVGNQYKNLADELAAAGIASLRIDFAGTGDSKQDYSAYSVTGAVSDAQKGFDYLAKLNEVDADRIGVVGYSQGGTIAIQFAVQNDKVKALCTWAGSPSMAASINEEGSEMNKLYKAAKSSKDGYVLRDMGFIKLNFGLQWFEEMSALDGLKDIAAYKGALLAINGDEDTSVPMENASAIVEAAGSTDAQVLIIKGADHLYGALDESPNPLTKELRDVTVDWFGRKL